MAIGNDQDLNIVVRLKDEASKSLEGLSKKFDDMQESMKPATNASKAFALALGGAATAAVGFGVIAVKAAMGAQVEMARFEATMKTIPGATDKVTKSLLDQAAAATKLGFDDEEAANTLAMLYQRTNDVTKATQLNALAMDLARAKNISLTEAGNMVNMVMSGAGKALKQYGIEIDDTLGPMAALEQLQGKVRGQAEGFTNTMQGQIEVLKVTWGNLLETVGEQLIPVLTEALKAITPFVEKLVEWAGRTDELIEWLKEHQTIMILVAGAITGALAPALLFSLIPAIYGVITAFAAGAIALAPWILGGTLIAGLIAGILWIVKNWDYCKEQLALTWEGIKIMFKEGVNFLIGLAEAWANMWVKAANVIIGALNKIKFSIPSWVPGIGGKSFGINIPLVEETKLPRYEHGGIVPGARGTAVPIMAHGGEQIIPAGNTRSDGGVYIEVNLNYPQFSSADQAAATRSQIEKALRDVVRVYKLQSA